MTVLGLQPRRLYQILLTFAFLWDEKIGVNFSSDLCWKLLLVLISPDVPKKCSVVAAHERWSFVRSFAWICCQFLTRGGHSFDLLWFVCSEFVFLFVIDCFSLDICFASSGFIQQTTCESLNPESCPCAHSLRQRQRLSKRLVRAT